MAKKEVPQEKTGEKKGNDLQNLLEPILDQIITEYTRPALKKIPAPVLVSLKKVGLTKVLPLIGVTLSALIRQRKYWWSDRVGDTISEATAELRRVINEATGEEGAEVTSARETAKMTIEKIKKNLVNTLLNPEIADEFAELLRSLSEIFKDKDGKDIPDKEKGQIVALLEQLSPIELLGFLKAKKSDREILLNLFIKKVKVEEKSLEQAIHELKESLREFKEKAKVVQEELFKPAWVKIKPGFEKVGEKLKKFDAKFAPDTEIRKKTEGFRSWAKKLKDEERAKHKH